ncbi:MAG: CotH kinase family protein, partial [Erysipelotrichaceae bacterium]|nr:CotH kinase family protein [Erysipelotrichaceae bacterium]
SLDPGSFRTLNAASGVRDLQFQAYAEFFETEGSFSIPCSIAAFGGNARFQKKKSYALRFSSRFGASSLHYQVFDNRDNSVYQALVLRDGSTDWSEAYMRDILGTSLVDDYTDVATQAYKSCVVYINGNYWGLYNIREKINKSFIEEHYNVPADTVNIARIDGKITAGTSAGYQQLRAFCNSHDLKQEENYEYLADHMNMTDICDYWIAETFTTNNDILNCRFYQSDDYDDGKWHYIFYDLDYAFYNYGVNYYTGYMTNPEGIGRNVNFENTIIRNLFRSSEFRNLWLERLSYNMKYTWNPEISLARLEEIYNMLEPEMDRNLQRWGLSRQHYDSCVDFLREYLTVRPDHLLKQTKDFFGLSNEEMKELFGDLWK